MYGGDTKKQVFIAVSRGSDSSVLSFTGYIDLIGISSYLLLITLQPTTRMLSKALLVTLTYLINSWG